MNNNNNNNDSGLNPNGNDRDHDEEVTSFLSSSSSLPPPPTLSAFEPTSFVPTSSNLTSPSHSSTFTSTTVVPPPPPPDMNQPKRQPCSQASIPPLASNKSTLQVQPTKVILPPPVPPSVGNDITTTTTFTNDDDYLPPPPIVSLSSSSIPGSTKVVQTTPPPKLSTSANIGLIAQPLLPPPPSKKNDTYTTNHTPKMMKSSMNTILTPPLESAPPSANINNINNNVIMATRQSTSFSTQTVQDIQLKKKEDGTDRNTCKNNIPLATTASETTTTTTAVNPQLDEDEPMKIPPISKRIHTTQINPYHNYNNPQNDLTLTPIQKSIPILILSTTTSQELIYEKNSVSISEFFTAIANSMSVTNLNSSTISNSFSNSISSNASVSSNGTVVASNTGISNDGYNNNSFRSTSSISSGNGSGSVGNGIRLPPLRSINGRSIQMKWDDLQFIFYNGRELDYGIGNDENTIGSNHNNKDSSNSSGNNGNGGGAAREGNKPLYFVNNERKLHCAAREDWYHDFFQQSEDIGSSRKSNMDTLSVEDIELHIEQFMRKRRGNKCYNIYNGQKEDYDDDERHNCNHKSQNTGKLTSWTELHENKEKVHEDPDITRQTDNASRAFDQLVAKTSQTPWLLRFRHALNSIASSSNTVTDVDKEKTPYYDSMLSCPPVILHIASSSDVDPIGALMEMKNSDIHLPNVCKNGFYDVNSMRKYYLILHDEVDGDVNFDEGSILNEMKAKFGSNRMSTSIPYDSMSGGMSYQRGNDNCYAVVRINSIPLDVAKSNLHKEDMIWDSFIYNKQWPTSMASFMQDSLKVRGSCLSSKDKSSLRKFIAQMVATSVLPSLERRIYNLNVEVTNAKKGVKNVFKSFWRKPKDSGYSDESYYGSTTGGYNNSSKPGLKGMSASDRVFYKFDSIESQTRLLADTLFTVKDYESALSMYRLVKDDYKHDQNLFHTASTNEMMALCLYMMEWHGDRDKREIIYHIEQAMDMYAAAAEDDPLVNNLDRQRPTVAAIATRCVTRLSLMLSSARSLCNGYDKEVAKQLGNASSQETPLGAAVLLEQSSAHYFRAGMYRKFAHHVLMAGHLYRSAGQEQHALRCFTTSMYIYHGSDRVWTELFDHVTSALAAQLYSMKRMSLSFELYARLVAMTGNERVSVKSQQKFLDNLLKISRGYQKEALLAVEKMKGIEDGANNVVLENTPGARRVLEIPELNIPFVFDNSIEIINTSLSNDDDSIGFGAPSKGSETVWQEMVISTEAELKANLEVEKKHFKTLTEQVIRNLDKGRADAMFLAKSKKSLSVMLSQKAKMEPITVSFTMSNPLGFLVPISSLQLIARLKSTDGEEYTSLDSIEIPSGTTTNSGNQKQWRWDTSNEVFEASNFARLSSTNSEGKKSWIATRNISDDPFFVVTKKAVAIDGLSKRKIVLSLCPLVMGDLEIIGIRCKIFNEIWVMHRFSVPLVKKSLKSGSRVHEKSTPLKACIVSEMPNLKVQMIPKVGGQSISSPMLQGQLSEWNLRITNQGNAPAGNIILKTNVPWINILHNGDKDAMARTSCCLGPSGTLMHIPISGDEMLGNNFLKPGQTNDIPIQIRTCGGGKQDFYMLFRYEKHEDISGTANPAPKIRWLRKMVSVAVYPSLTVKASLIPLYSNKSNDYVLSLEMTNYRSDKKDERDQDICVETVSVASKNYKIKPLIEDNMKERKVLGDKRSKGHSIGWNEQVSLHYLISPNDINLPGDILSHCSMATPSNEQKHGSDIMDFACLEHAFEKFKAAIDNHSNKLAVEEAEKEKEGQHPRSIAQIRRANEPKSSKALGENNENDGSDQISRIHDLDSHSHPTSLDSLCSSVESSSDINVICSWTSKGQGCIVGRHHLTELAVRPEFNCKGCPVLISSKHKSSFLHDFTTGPLSVKMEISIRNRLVKAGIDFEFSLDPRQEFDFVGTTQFKWKLGGDQEITFPVEALIFNDGLIDLQCVRVTVFQKDGSKMPYVFPLQWIVNVTNTAR